MCSITCITLEEEMKKNLELKMSDIQIFREWCDKQPHLPKIQDMELAIFLHCNYYRIEPAKNTIENYYTMRTHVPEFFSNRDILKVKELRESYKITAHLFLEGKTKEGYSIMMGRFIDFDPSRYIFNDSTKGGFMVCEEFLWTQGSTPGFIYVGDATGITIEHISRLHPATLKKLVFYLQDAFPIRLLAIHVINTSPLVKIIFNMFKPFIKMELIRMIYFHSSMESAGKYFPIDVLPNELGGRGGALEELIEAQVKKVEDFREWYLMDEKVNRVNESLRIGKSKTSDDLFGVEGSFKKLEID